METKLHRYPLNLGFSFQSSLIKKFIALEIRSILINFLRGFKEKISPKAFFSSKIWRMPWKIIKMAHLQQSVVKIEFPEILGVVLLRLLSFLLLFRIFRIFIGVQLRGFRLFYLLFALLLLQSYAAHFSLKIFKKKIWENLYKYRKKLEILMWKKSKKNSTKNLFETEFSIRSRSTMSKTTNQIPEMVRRSK